MFGLTSVALFIVPLFFSLFVYCLWLRLACRFFRISSLNQLSQLVNTVTDPLVDPIQKLLKPQPGQRFDVATMTAIVLVGVFKIFLISIIAFHGLMSMPHFIAYVLADLIIQPCDLLFFIILIRVIMSFVNPTWSGPIADALCTITDPLLKLGRKIVPNISGFDFSPFIILMILKVITLFINANLPWRLL